MIPSRRTFLGSGAALLALSATAGIAQPDDMTPEAIFHDPDGPALGNPDADLTIVEFFDYQCPFCKKGHPELMDVVESDGNIRLVMKDWPIFGAPSIRASQLVLGAAGIDQYRTAHLALMATEARLSEKQIERTLKKAGIDVAKADAAYRKDRSTWDGYMQRNSYQASALGLRGTPAFIIGKTIYPGAMNRAELKEAIAEVRG